MADEDDETTTAGEPPPASTPARRIGKPFERGNKANPGGRPKTDARLKLTLADLSLTAVRELGRLLKDRTTPKKTRASIAIYIIDRKLGRPTTAIAGADGAPLFPGAQPNETSTNPLMVMLARLAAQRDAARAEGQPTTTSPASAAPGANGSEPGRPS